MTQKLSGPPASRSALKIAVIYFVLGVLWILFSDRALRIWFTTPEEFLRYSTYKGWVFILCTAVLIFFLIRSSNNAFVRANRRLQENERRLRLVLSAVNLRLWTRDETNQTISYESTEDLVRPLDSVTEIPPEFVPESSVIPAEDRDRIAHAWDLYHRGEKPIYECEHRVHHAPGETRWVLCRGQVVERDANGRPLRTSGTHLDISDRKWAELALQESEQRFRDLFIEAPLAYQSLDADRRLLDVNNDWCGMLACRREEAIGRRFDDFVSPADFERFRESFARYCEDGKICNGEFRLMRKDGGEVVVRVDGRIGRHPNGSFKQTHCILRDVTDQRRAEMEMLQLATAIGACDDAIVITDIDNKIIYANNGFVRVSGYSRSEALGRDPDDLNGCTRENPELYKQIRTTIRSGRMWKGRKFNNRRDGSKIEVDATISPVFSGEGRIVGFVRISRDITEQRQLEAQLRHAQKMEAVGQLAGGVAHDFNNLLQVILGHTELMLHEPCLTADSRTGLEQISEAAERAKSLVRQLLTLSRRTAMQLRPLDLSRIIGELMKMLRRVIGANIELKLELTEGAGLVNADAGQVEQVLMNLCVNARDAMESNGAGGRITIATRRVSLDALFCERHAWARQGDFILMSVCDTGEGIPAHLRERIFEPFFTTKEIGKGTGLGLSVVYGIVRQHDGFICLESQEGHGATFHIYWPVTTGQTEDQPPAERVPLHKGAGEVILIAEDNELVRNLATRILRAQGYRVLPAGDGEEALQVFDNHREAVSLALLDVIMPNMGGFELGNRLLQLRPTLPIIFCSGFTPESPAPTAVDGNPIPLIHKPYRPSELLRHIRACLHKT